MRTPAPTSAESRFLAPRIRHAVSTGLTVQGAGRMVPAACHVASGMLVARRIPYRSGGHALPTCRACDAVHSGCTAAAARGQAGRVRRPRCDGCRGFGCVDGRGHAEDPRLKACAEQRTRVSRQQNERMPFIAVLYTGTRTQLSDQIPANPFGFRLSVRSTN
jgi:hypothetical protein